VIKTLRRRMGTVALIAAALWLTVYPVLAMKPEDEEVRRILEKSLSSVELDKEIAHIAEQKTKISEELARSLEQLQQQEALMQTHQEDAGRVLRAYYMGERDLLLTALLSSDSLADLLAMIDYFDFIFSGDRRQLNSYVEQYRAVKKIVAKQTAESEQLTRIEEKLIAQRDRLAALQQEVNNDLSGRSDEERLRLMIQEMTNFWQNVGFYEVKRYFKELANAMNKLPGWVQDNKDMLEIDGLTYTLTVPEDKLNEFLREQNELFNNFNFHFEDGVVSVSGKREGLAVEISGRYVIINEPKNGLVFQVEKLLFNGLALPEETRSALEQEFDLGFYPERIISFLKAKSVAVQDGKLIVKLAIRL